MKRALILTLLLLALSVSGLCLAHGEINSSGDKVELSEKVIFGDKAAADGVKLESRVCMNRHLFWNTEYTIGDEPEAKTEYRFSQSRDSGDERLPTYGVNIDNGFTFGFYFERDTDMSKPQKGIEEAYRQLYNETPEGQEGKKTFYLKDYCDYYPLSVNICLPGTYIDWNTDYQEEQPVSETGEPIKIVSQLRDYFKIPVLEDERWEISLVHDYDGGVSGMGNGGADGDFFSLWTVSAISDDACYFTFNNRANEGKPIDTSHIPGGYGIYCLPYFEGSAGYVDMGDGSYRVISGASVGELSTVYPIDPEAELINLLINAEKTKLLLLTNEQEMCVLTVIDIDSMEAVQRLELAELNGETWAYVAQNSDGFLVVELSGNRIIVVDINEKGEYEHRFTATYTDPDDPLFYAEHNSSMDWDGKRLVIADNLRHEEYGEQCGFYVAVCDENGLLYYGEYQSSLDVGNTSFDGNYKCRPVNNEPIRVSWK